MASCLAADSSNATRKLHYRNHDKRSRNRTMGTSPALAGRGYATARKSRAATAGGPKGPPGLRHDRSKLHLDFDDQWFEQADCLVKNTD